MNWYKEYKIAQSELQLLPVEDQIFTFIRSAKAAMPQLQGVQTLVAGGWVRDKLMGKDSDDIDIAISNMNGEQFAQLLNQFANQTGVRGVGVAHSLNVANKTAEDAEATENLDEDGFALLGGGIDIFGQKVEFIRMRTEKYQSGSRTPQVAPSNDVYEDVKRRDLTINAMYYDIDNGQVVDPSGKGREDLETMTLRTPLEDTERTFLEDPLRMLRVLRFHARYPNSTIDPKIVEVMNQAKDPNSEFSKEYKASVHASRGAKEIRKMLEAPSSIDAVKQLFDSGFYKLALQVPDKYHPIDVDQQSPFHELSLKDHTLEVMRNIQRLIAKQDADPKVQAHDAPILERMNGFKSKLADLKGQYNDELPKAEKRNLQKQIDVMQDNIHKQQVNLLGVAPEDRGLLMTAAMFHDFGKMDPNIRLPHPKGETVERDGQQVPRMRYVGHEAAGAEFVKGLMNDMGFEAHEKFFVENVVAGHMDPHGFVKDQKSATLSKAMGRFMNQYPQFWNLIHLHAHADALSKKHLDDADTSKLDEINEQRAKSQEQLREYYSRVGDRATIPLLDGNVIRDEMKVNAGRQLLKKRLSKDQVRNMTPEMIMQSLTQDELSIVNKFIGGGKVPVRKSKAQLKKERAQWETDNPNKSFPKEQEYNYPHYIGHAHNQMIPKQWDESISDEEAAKNWLASQSPQWFKGWEDSQRNNG